MKKFGITQETLINEIEEAKRNLLAYMGSRKMKELKKDSSFLGLKNEVEVKKARLIKIQVEYMKASKLELKQTILN